VNHFIKIIIVLQFAFFLEGNAQYAVNGKVNLGGDWQPKIYMASVNKLSDYYRTSPDMIVNTASVSPDGTFSIKGDNLPKEERFYRIYLMKTHNTDNDACLYSGDDHNFAHLLLKDGESVEITTDNKSLAPFGEYSVSGDLDNQYMQNLARIVFPSFYFYRIKFPTELKFSEDKLHSDLKGFADTCSNTLVALAAINNTDFEQYFDQDLDFYQSFGNRLEKEMPNSIYTKNYLLKLRYYANEDYGVPAWLYWLLGLLGIGLLAALGKIMTDKWKISGLEEQVRSLSNPKVKETAAFESLTQKEQEIFKLIGEGKSNKEIASSLFVELSTIKTHINKIYSKLGVSNRKEAQTLAKQQGTVA